MNKKIMILWIFIMIIVVDFSNGNLNSSEILPESCTVFTASMGDTVLFGNNEDVGDKSATVWFAPATEKTYGWVYFGFRNYPILRGHFPMGGMNDQGLCFDITSIPESKMGSYPGKLPVVNGGVFGETVLKNCKTIEEAVQFIERYDLSSFGDMQFLFADRAGNSMVLCPGTDGKMKVIKKAGVYQVTTNFNLLQRNQGYPCWRYNTASEMLAEIKNEDDLTVEYFLEILKATCNQATTYSTIYDPVHGIAYFYNKQNFEDVAVFDLKDELEKGSHSYDAFRLFPKKNSEDLEESESPGEVKESEEPEPVSKWTPFGSFSGFLYVIPAVALVILAAFVYRKVKKEKKEMH
ncbi:MAG: linear amide C-N hydrolase [Candidatus Methanofastidiosia archaeon]